MLPELIELVLLCFSLVLSFISLLLLFNEQSEHFTSFSAFFLRSERPVRSQFTSFNFGLGLSLNEECEKQAPSLCAPIDRQTDRQTDRQVAAAPSVVHGREAKGSFGAFKLFVRFVRCVVLFRGHGSLVGGCGAVFQ